MNKIVTCLALFVALIVVTPLFAFQDPDGKKSKAPTKPTPTAKKPAAENPRKPPVTARSRPTVTGEVTVKTMLAGCTVTLNGKARGNTDREGLLNLSNLTPGEYILIVGKPGYQQEERRISVAVRESQIVEVVLIPLPVALSVNVNIAGAKIQIANLTFEDSVTDLLLAPNNYEISVSKPGYKTLLSWVELTVGKPKKINLTLVKVPVETLLAQVEESFKAQQYDQVIADCLDVISAVPDQPRATLLLGQSYFNKGNHTDSVFYLVKAVRLGEQVTLPIKHHNNSFTKGDELCSGQLILQKDSFEFRAVDSDHSFSPVPWSKLYELGVGVRRNTPQLHTRVGVLKKNKKESKDNFNFFAAQSETRRSNPNLVASTVVYCQNCQPTIDAIYQILQRLKK